MPKLSVTCFSFLLLLSSAACRQTANIAISDPKDTLLIYIMAGQSNMAGRGDIEREDTVSDPRILSMDATDHFITAKEPLNFYQPNFAGLDCGLSFGHLMLLHLPAGKRIGLIPCAVGSSSIEEWLYDSTRIVHLYTNLISRARAGQLYGVIKGVLWHQGESNADNSSYKVYEPQLLSFIAQLRRDLAVPELPVYLGKLAGFYRGRYRDDVNLAMEHVAGQLRYVYTIETGDLTCKPDSIHFDANAQRTLGARYAACAINDLYKMY